MDASQQVQARVEAANIRDAAGGAAAGLAAGSDISRRLVLGGGIAAGVSALAFPLVGVRAQEFSGGNPAEAGQGFWERPRWLWLSRPATREQIKLTYWHDGQLDQDAYRQASWFLRDARFARMLAGSVTPKPIASALDRGLITRQQLTPWMMMDPVLLDILYAYCAWLQYAGVQSPLIINSGFRHPVTNAMTEGAARDSWHTRGGAGDIVVPGVQPVALARFGRWLSGGGVGLYENKGFIHVDRGRLRNWRG